MMSRNYEKLFPVLEELNVGFVAFLSLVNGVLSGAYNANSSFERGTDYRADMPQFTPQAFEENSGLFELLHDLAESKNATPAQISLAWMLCKKSYIVPIPGSRKLSRLQENAKAADIYLSAEEVLSIDEALENTHMSSVFGGHR